MCAKVCAIVGGVVVVAQLRVCRCEYVCVSFIDDKVVHIFADVCLGGDVGGNRKTHVHLLNMLRVARCTLRVPLVGAIYMCE